MKTNKGCMILCIVLAVCLVAAVGVYIAISTTPQDAKSIESPFVAPEICNIYVRYPDWDPSQGDPPDTPEGLPFWKVVYPEHWSIGDRASWLLQRYNTVYYGHYLANNEDFFAVEENLREVAWFEAELDLLDSLQNPILENLGIDREDYLVRK